MKKFIFKNLDKYYSIKNNKFYQLPNANKETIINYGMDSNTTILLSSKYTNLIVVNNSYIEQETVYEQGINLYSYISELPEIIIYSDAFGVNNILADIEPSKINSILPNNIKLLQYINTVDYETSSVTCYDNLSPLNYLDGEIRLLNWTNDTTYTSKTAKLNIKPKENTQTIFANSDISLLGVERIDSLNLNSNGDIRVGMSFDGGNTYYSYIDGNWTNIKDIRYGMNSTTLNSLTQNTIDTIKGTSETLRFAYYITEDSYIDSIIMTVTMQGYEKIADTKDYTLSYDQAQKKLIYNITKSGTYSVNYVDGST